MCVPSVCATCKVAGINVCAKCKVAGSNLTLGTHIDSSIDTKFRQVTTN